MSLIPDWHYQRNSRIPEGRQLPAGIQRVAAALEYHGGEGCGWQRQAHSASIQEAVESALSAVADEPVQVACAGRTDTGVHATNQIIHFDTAAQRNPRNWLLGANANLPDGVRLHWARQMPPRFHARFSALSRTYRYVIANEPYRPALFSGFVTWIRHPLAEKTMHRAAQALLGERDFSAFRAAGCQSHTPFRRVDRVRVWREGTRVIVEITANAFLHHMVRNIAGALIAVGQGKQPEDWPGRLLAGGDRCLGEATAPAAGLYLVAVAYPDEFEMPSLAPGPYLVAEGQDEFW